MTRLEIFNLAVEEYSKREKEFLDCNKNGIASSFGIIDKVLSSIYEASKEEDLKKEGIKQFEKYIRGNEKRKYLFNIKSDIFVRVFNGVFSKTFKEQIVKEPMSNIYYYFCCYQRIYKAKIQAGQLKKQLDVEREVIHSLEKERSLRTEQERQQIEEEKKQNEQELLKKMNVGERIRYEIGKLSINEKEGYVSNVLSEISKKDRDEQILIGNVLKQYYIEMGIWDKKSNAKKERKMQQIKEILQDNEGKI